MTDPESELPTGELEALRNHLREERLKTALTLVLIVVVWVACVVLYFLVRAHG